MNEAVREMTFEEEAALYEKEARELFAKENPGYEAPPINHTVRRGMRIISKAKEEIEWLSKRWISVEERLPDAEQEVRVLCKASWNSRYRYQCQAFYEPKGMLRENSNYGWDYECCSEYSEEDDDYFVNPGWYERIHNWDDYSAVGIADEVTHWMPLPSPPKEEV